MSKPPETARGGAYRPLIGVAALLCVAALALLGLARPDLLGHGPDRAGFDGAPADGPTVETARAEPAHLLSHVLGRVYAAFGEREEGAIYDALASVAAGSVLDELYLERRAALTAMPAEAGGQEIHGIYVLEADAEERDGMFLIEGAWETVGSVGHGDHVHLRGNRYAARLTVEPRAEGWRLTDFDLLEMIRAENAAEPAK